MLESQKYLLFQTVFYQTELINSSSNLKMKESEKIGKYAGLLSLIEIGLGSFLHSLRLPFSGHSLSLNQAFILTHASIAIEERKSPALISTTAALLKSLSPAGKKLTPMLAISAQGHLFSLGTILLGNNIIGHLLGTCLLSLWAFIQPLMIYLLLFGKDFIYMINYFIKKINPIFPVTQDGLLYAIITIVIIKIVIGLALVFFAHYSKNSPLSIYEAWAKRYKPKRKNINKSPYIEAFKDLFSPMFVVSISMMAIFFFFARSASSQSLWLLMRPVAFGYLVFLFIRIFPIEVLIRKMKDGKYKEALKEALKHLKD